VLRIDRSANSGEVRFNVKLVDRIRHAVDATGKDD